jgi:hypothetical protein
LAILGWLDFDLWSHVHLSGYRGFIVAAPRSGITNSIGRAWGEMKATHTLAI